MYEGRGINRTLFSLCFLHTENRVKYEYGAKPELGSDSSTFEVSDCSGWTAWINSRCVDPLLPLEFLHGGSVQQHEWCEANLQKVPVEVAAADDTNQMYQFFLAPADSADGIGHTGFWQNRESKECYGGHGVGSRPAQHLISIGVKYAYLWPSFVE